jgi:hypothetical protein
MKNGSIGSAKLTATRRKAAPTPGLQEAILTVYGNPEPALIRVTDDRYLPLAQRMAAILRRPMYIVSPSQTALADPAQTPIDIPQPAPPAFPASPSAAPQPLPAACGRCFGRGKLTNGTTCHICNGSGKAR